MHILFIAQCYAPEDVSAAVLITELAEDLARLGHQVVMVTGAPSYPRGQVFPGYRNRVLHAEWHNGVRVIRVWSYISPSKGFTARTLHYGTFSAAAFYGSLFAGQPDVLVSYSPPLPLGLTAWALSRLWNIPWILQIEDMFPDAAIAAGALKNQPAIRFFYQMERFLYHRVDHISVISERFKTNLIDKQVPAEKISVITSWADPGEIYPKPKQNAFRLKHGLAEKFLVLYTGNLGLTSCLEDMIDTAVLVKDLPSVLFLFVGEGVKKEALQDAARRQELKNIQFLPYQPREDLCDMLAAADLCLVTLNEKSADSSLPHKVFNYMSSGRPVLSVSPPDSGLARLVVEGNFGINVSPGNPATVAVTIRNLYQKEEYLQSLGQAGRNLLESKYSRSHCIKLYEEMLRNHNRTHSASKTRGSVAQ